jgi:hypothetical protein
MKTSVPPQEKLTEVSWLKQVQVGKLEVQMEDCREMLHSLSRALGET